MEKAVLQPCPRCGGKGLWKPAGNFIAPVCQNCGLIGSVFYNDLNGITTHDLITAFIKEPVVHYYKS
jgi:hypothetical protein